MASDGVDWENSVFIIDTRMATPADCLNFKSPPIAPEEPKMPGEVDPTIAKQMDQNFANFNARLNEAAHRHNSGAEFINQQAQMQFMLQQQLVGAKAAGQLDRDSLAKSRLDAAAVGMPAKVT